MFIDARKLADGAEVRADICVIGSGAAGGTLAMALADAGRSVVVLEGGGLGQESQAQETLRGGAGGTGSHDPLDAIRQKRLGGTTMQWGGRCTPLDEHDFRRRPHVPHSGWPIGPGDLNGYYRRAHEILDLGDDDYTASGAVTDVPTLFSPRPGASPVLDDDRIWRWGPPVQFGATYRKRLEWSPRIQTYLYANVVELRQAPDGGRVEEVVIAPVPGRTVVVRPRVVVVAAGGLETARLLLVSDATSRGGLGNGSGALGRYYMTHPIAEVGELTLSDPALGRVGDFMLTRDGVYARRQIAARPLTQEREGLLNVGLALWYPDPMNPAHGDALLSAYALARKAMTLSGLNWKASGAQRRYGATPHVPAHLRNIGRGLPGLLSFSAMWVQKRYLSDRTFPSFVTQPKNGVYRLRMDAEQSPDASNRVELSTDRDAYGVRRLALHFRVSDSDRKSYQRTFEVVRDEFERAGVGTLRLEPHNQLLEQEFVDGTHQMGLTRMSATERDGVVDPNCRVWGVPNLFVSSSSVFPTSGMCGPTLTVTALALRLAEHLVATD